MRTEYEYSKDEWRIIVHYGLADIANEICPAILYQMLAKAAFIRNDGSDFEGALRKAVVAMDKCHPLRMTPQWDDLVRVHE